MIGAVQYNIAATTGLADNFPAVYNDWTANTYKWASTVMYTWGGGFFLISGLCYVLLDMGLPGIYLGTTAFSHTKQSFVSLTGACVHIVQDLSVHLVQQQGRHAMIQCVAML